MPQGSKLMAHGQDKFYARSAGPFWTIRSVFKRAWTSHVRVFLNLPPPRLSCHATGGRSRILIFFVFCSFRLTNGMSRFINVLTRLINVSTRFIGGITWLVDGWGYQPGPPGPRGVWGPDSWRGPGHDPGPCGPRPGPPATNWPSNAIKELSDAINQPIDAINRFVPWIGGVVSISQEGCDVATPKLYPPTSHMWRQGIKKRFLIDHCFQDLCTY